MRTRANSLWMTMIRTVIMATGKTMLLTMAMKMRMRCFFGIPSLLNQDGDENEARSKLTVDGDSDGLSSRSSAVARGTRNLQQSF